MVKRLHTLLVSILFLTACSTTSQSHLDSERNTENVVTGNVTVDSQNSTKVESEHDSEGNSKLQSDSPPHTDDRESIVTQGSSATQVDTEAEKGIGTHFIFDNTATKSVLKSLESVTDTLNVLSFGIFVTGNG